MSVETNAWNPGIQSQIPAELQHLSTIFRPENAFTDIATARELRDLTGLPLSELAALRPQRLALHELLIRVTADFSVPDGQRIEDLGINLRQITRELFAACIEPRMDEIVAAYDALRTAFASTIDAALAELFPPAPDAGAPRTRSPLSKLRSVLASRRSVPIAQRSDEDRERLALSAWDAAAHATTDELQKAAYAALIRVVSALVARHGSVWAGRELISRLAVDLASNTFGSEEIGRLLDPWIRKSASGNGYRLLPAQSHPLVMNTKGASASGKSTLRPLQKSLAGDIGVTWSEFALISPDIWRKQLLDYDSLGPHYKYAGAFTGDELSIVDQKLDRYMAAKARRGDMPHLLIDRFRFDSFAPDSDEPGSNLLTRFGHVVYLFFLITPPASLVERAWNRGLEFGRYKAVDDTLAHCVEAYSGLPQVFFTWVRRTDKRVHFEFLDNSVRFGERPRTAAFGWNDQLNVLDVGPLLDIERFQRVDIEARAPAALYRDRESLAPERNTRFLAQCLQAFREINFAVQATGRVYLQIVDGSVAWVDPEMLTRAAVDADTRAGVMIAAPNILDGALPPAGSPRYLDGGKRPQRVHTVGNWGPSFNGA